MAVNLLREALEQANVSEEDIVSLPYHVIFMDCQVCSTKTLYLCMCRHAKLRLMIA
jgi:hypothetical protein